MERVAAMTIPPITANWLNALFEEQKRILHAQIDLQCAGLHRHVDETCTIGTFEHWPPENGTSKSSWRRFLDQANGLHTESETQAEECGDGGKSCERPGKTPGASSVTPREDVQARVATPTLASVTPREVVQARVATPSEVDMTASRSMSNNIHRKSMKFETLMRTQSTDNLYLSRLPFWRSERLDPIIGIVIIANVFVQFVQLQFLGQLADKSLGLEVNVWSDAELAFNVLDFGFTAFFVVELIFRVCASGRKFFSSGFDILDAVVVPLTALDTFILSPLRVAESSNINVSTLRTLRIFRMVRTLRVVRTLSRFRQLRVLWNTILASLKSLGSSMVTMCIFMLVLALFMTQSLHYFIVDDSESIEAREWVNKAYGDGIKSLWTVFALTFSGCWPNYVAPIVEHVSWVYALVFVFYVSCVVFAMTRIVAALFLKETLHQANEDADAVIKERAQEIRNLEENLFGLFKASDKDGNGLLTEDEICRVLNSDRIKLWLGRLGIDAADPAALFKMLDTTGEKVITWDAFVYGLKRIKGEARAQDLIPLVNDCKRILRHCEQMQHLLTQAPQTQGQNLANV